MSEERLIVRLDADLVQRMEELRSQSGDPDAAILRDAIRLLHQSRKRPARKSRKASTLLERLVELGIFGKHRGLPRDLSTNRRYMRGFGEN